MLEEVALTQNVVEVTPENTKVFEVPGIFGYFDSNVYNFDAITISETWNVPVIADDGRKLGYANVGIVGDPGGLRLEGTMFIDYATEERLLIETGSMQLWPRISGALFFDVPSRFLDLAKPVAVRGFFLREIVLSPECSADTRLPYAGQLGTVLR